MAINSKLSKADLNKPSNAKSADPYEYDEDASAFEGQGRPIHDGEHVVRLSQPDNNPDPKSFDWVSRDDEGNEFNRTDFNIPYQLELIDDSDTDFGRKGFGRFSTMPIRTLTGKRTTEAGSMLKIAAQKATWDPESDAHALARVLGKGSLTVLAKSTWVTRIEYIENADPEYQLAQKKVIYRRGEKRHPVGPNGEPQPLSVVEADTDFEIKIKGQKQKVTVLAGTPLVTRSEWSGFKPLPE